MWWIYSRTRKDGHYTNYKKALNAVTTEIRQYSKISYEKKLACNITNESKTLYAYVRNKQNVRDKVGPVPDAKFQDAKSDYLGQLIITPEHKGNAR